MSWLRPKQKKAANPEAEKLSRDTRVEDSVAKLSIKDTQTSFNKSAPRSAAIEPNTAQRDKLSESFRQNASNQAKPQSVGSSYNNGLQPQSQRKNEIPRGIQEDHGQVSQHQMNQQAVVTPESFEQNRKVGVLAIKILCGRGVIANNKAQIIASYYSNYKNEVQQRPFAVISFDKNEVIAAPLGGDMINPAWEYRANFDVSRGSDITVSLYQQVERRQAPQSNRSAPDYNQQTPKQPPNRKVFDTVFLGKAQISPVFNEGVLVDNWYPLSISGHIRLQYTFNRKENIKLSIDNFDLLKVIGRGSFGKVFQVRKKDTGRIYAMKVLSKSKIIMRSEVAHTLAERNVLARINHPFIVPLKFSFQNPEKLYLVLAFINGGELFHHLHREGRFDQHLSRFYAAELLCALECLHSYDVVYRDLKPENILLDYSGHVALCDFGLCKLNMTDERKTNTFCGTPEYLAPELLLGRGYTRTVDWWTFGILLYEMLTGLPPFYSENPNEMYRRVLEDRLVFPDDMGSRAKMLIKGLLVRDPTLRLGCNGASEIKSQPFFAEIDWDLLLAKKYDPPFKPYVSSAFDTSNFEDEFTTELPEDSYIPDSNLSETVQQQFSGFTYDGSGGAFSLAQSVMMNNNPINERYER
ncbi:hypothetical protein BB558_001868 [Smittium angustum]|uniref:non-specific serine/threonine protein kinase n=1 Tax=Smittium angustum TaxID=133377 RepID=A0A2U1JAG3_SMIAN|nr:hypothetical protein BB558_001868 [Smittium angustum]